MSDAEGKMPAIERVSLMESNHVAELISGLRATPSRRAVATAVAALAASTPLAPFLGRERAAAGGKGQKKGKKKGKKKDEKKDKKRKKWTIDELPPLPPPPACAQGQVRCPNSALCYSAADETCCDPTAIGLVGTCPKGTFCGNPLADVPFCCPTGSEKCVVGCCSPGLFCCSGVCCDNAECRNEGIFGPQCHPILLGTPARIK